MWSSTRDSARCAGAHAGLRTNGHVQDQPVLPDGHLVLVGVEDAVVDDLATGVQRSQRGLTAVVDGAISQVGDRIGVGVRQVVVQTVAADTSGVARVGCVVTLGVWYAVGVTVDDGGPAVEYVARGRLAAGWAHIDRYLVDMGQRRPTTYGVHRLGRLALPAHYEHC